MEAELTREFRDLVRQQPWLWDTKCWHPHKTPLSQCGLGLDVSRHRNGFDAKLEARSTRWKSATSDPTSHLQLESGRPKKA